MASLTVTVQILGQSKWDWGKGDVIVVRIDERYFAYCLEREDETEADEIEPTTAMSLLTGRRVKLTAAGREWMREQRDLRAKLQAMGRKPASLSNQKGVE
jgi:hypothetical protein